MRAGHPAGEIGQWRQMEPGRRFDYPLLPKADPPGNCVTAHYGSGPLSDCSEFVCLGFLVSCCAPRWMREL